MFEALQDAREPRSPLPRGGPLPEKTGMPGVSAGATVCRVLHVCESAVHRHVLARIFDGDARFTVAGTVRRPTDVIEAVEKVGANAVVFSEEAPEVEVRSTVRQLRERRVQVGAVSYEPVTERCIVLCAVAERPARGDAPWQPSAGGPASAMERTFAGEVKRKLMQVCGAFTFAEPAPAGERTAARASQANGVARGRDARAQASVLCEPQVLVIGCSTGGPSALTQLLPALPFDFPLPVLIVQHMPPHFTRLLAERLSRLSSIPVVEAEEGAEVSPGTALLAPGDFHMRLARKLHRVEVRLTQDDMENSCRPAVDVLFRSVAEVYKGAAIATVLTGMGQDGLKGVRALKELGAPVLVQDRESSVVWGMPGAIAGAGLADAVLPLSEIAPAILGRL